MYKTSLLPLIQNSLLPFFRELRHKVVLSVPSSLVHVHKKELRWRRESSKGISHLNWTQGLIKLGFKLL